jgi:hypothetical protein
VRRKNMILKYLVGEKICVTGSSAYSFDNYTPGDVDICVLCRDHRSSYERILSKLKKFAEDMDAEIKCEAEYHLPFDWGGCTYARVKILQYDVFLVDRRTYDAIEKTTYIMKTQLELLKSTIAKYKPIRVELFRVIATATLFTREDFRRVKYAIKSTREIE